MRGLLLAVLPGAWLPIAAQAVGGISAAVFGVMFPLLAADITRGTSHFNLCMGALGLAVSLGAALSTTLGGWIADAAGVQLAFALLALIGLLGDAGGVAGDAGNAQRLTPPGHGRSASNRLASSSAACCWLWMTCFSSR